MQAIQRFRREEPVWCPGCGDYAVLKALQNAAAELGLRPEDIVLVAGIGCSGFVWSYFHSNSLKALHGRTLPAATGIKLANRALTVIAVSGDGDAYSIGGNHLIHTIRRNVDLTYIVMDNGVYGNTRGQTSPTSSRGFRSASTPWGAVEEPLHPLALALACGATFLAQGFSGNVSQLTRLLKEGILHKGFALVNVLSPCLIYNREQSYEWYRKRIVNLDEDASHDPRSRDVAIRRAMEFDRIYTGLIYREERPSFEEVLPGASDVPISQLDLAPAKFGLERLVAAEFGTG